MNSRRIGRQRYRIINSPQPTFGALRSHTTTAEQSRQTFPSRKSVIVVMMNVLHAVVGIAIAIVAVHGSRLNELPRFGSL